MKREKMIKRVLITLILLFSILPCVLGQAIPFEREVTLYNPYRPSLNVATKRSFLPELNDPIQARPQFEYNVNAQPLMPEYTISPIRAAELLPEPLPKLYKSYINAGLGTQWSGLLGLGEISIASERAQKGAIGFYGRHFSSTGKIKLDNNEKVNAGYMDNEALLFGKKLFSRSVLEGSAFFTQNIRHAYGYDTDIIGYIPEKDDIKIKYNDVGAKLAFYSTNLDSTRLNYNFNLSYDYFFYKENISRHRVLADGLMAKSIKTLYAGVGINYELYMPSDPIFPIYDNEFIFAISPFLKKSTSKYNFKLGLELLRNRAGELRVYPNLNLGFTIVPSYINFFTSLDGYLERNDPTKILDINPFLLPDAYFFHGRPDTDHEIVATAGLKGSNGIGGRYLISASYSIIDDMLFYSNLISYSNLVSPNGITPSMGNYFIPIVGGGNILNIHGEITGKITDKLSFSGSGNIYDYNFERKPWNKPAWDAKFGLDYNLKNKILAGAELTAIGKRTNVISQSFRMPLQHEIEMPVHYNLNLKAEYRYSKTLSFWLKLNNIALKDYYEWAFYPSHRFMFMAGVSCSLW